MKTYAEKNRKKPFDWNAFLDKAIKNGVSEKEYNQARELSKSWVTCACGNQCDILERYDKGLLGACNQGEPKDEILSDLGGEFFDRIRARNWKSAKQVLRKIENRSKKLINQKLKDSQKLLESFGYSVITPN